MNGGGDVDQPDLCYYQLHQVDRSTSRQVDRSKNQY